MSELEEIKFELSALNEKMDNESGSTAPDEYWKDFVSQGGWDGKGGKRPQNDTRKKES